jgi:hypothetical protein
MCLLVAHTEWFEAVWGPTTTANFDTAEAPLLKKIMKLQKWFTALLMDGPVVPEASNEQPNCLRCALFEGVDLEVIIPS